MYHNFKNNVYLPILKIKINDLYQFKKRKEAQLA